MTQETRTLDPSDLAGAPVGQETYLVLYLARGPRVLPVARGSEVTIGRSRACTVWVDDERVSRSHARITRRGDDLILADLGSHNGTRVGGEQVRGERKLRAGEVIALGPLVAVVAFAPPPAGGDPKDEGADAEAAFVIADSVMAEIYERCQRVAGTPLSVLVVGETGVGKEHVAETVHRLGPRVAGPFVRLHLAALPEALIEGELFGHEKGAFTGAGRRHTGYFESAAGGTLFLDEIGELAPATQAKLLRAIETKRIVRLGSTDEIEVDVRIIAATNRDLAAEVRAGRFREDLFFRVSAFRIDVPPLRQRRAEIPLLASLFARRIARASARPTPGLGPEVLAALEGYSWPGNVRELRHVVEAACVLAAPGDVGLENLPEAVRSGAGAGAGQSPSEEARAAPEPLRAQAGQAERAALLAALETTGGNQTRAAAQLGISRRTLIYKMRKHGIRSVRTIE